MVCHISNLGPEIYILLGGLILTVAVLCYAAYSKVRVKLSAMDILSTLLAAGDFLTDIIITVTMWRRLSRKHTTADQVIAALLLLFVLLPTAASASQLFLVLHSPQLRDYLDRERFEKLSGFYAFILFLALTNMELLRLLPWREGVRKYDGLPDKRLMLRIWLLVMCLEDVPQLVIQVALLTLGLADTSTSLASLSIFFSVSAIVWRSLHKMIFLEPVNIIQEAEIEVQEEEIIQEEEIEVQEEEIIQEQAPAPQPAAQAPAPEPQVCARRLVSWQ